MSRFAQVGNTEEKTQNSKLTDIKAFISSVLSFAFCVLSFEFLSPRFFLPVTTACALALALALSSCTGLFSTIFHQDDPSLFVTVPPKYRLPFADSKNHHLLVQGVGGRFSHTDDSAWSFDWSMPTGIPVLAARDGVVSSFRCGPEDRSLPLEKRPSNYIRIRHADATVACYAHLDSVCVAIGESVRTGAPIGWSGNTGYSTQPHLHFHVESGTITIPIAFIDVDDPGGIPRVGKFYP